MVDNIMIDVLLDVGRSVEYHQQLHCLRLVLLLRLLQSSLMPSRDLPQVSQIPPHCAMTIRKPVGELLQPLLQLYRVGDVVRVWDRERVTDLLVDLCPCLNRLPAAQLQRADDLVEGLERFSDKSFILY